MSDDRFAPIERRIGRPLTDDEKASIDRAVEEELWEKRSSWATMVATLAYVTDAAAVFVGPDRERVKIPIQPLDAEAWRSKVNRRFRFEVREIRE